MKEYFTDNTFELYNTNVVTEFCSNINHQSTMKEQILKVGRKY